MVPVHRKTDIEFRPAVLLALDPYPASVHVRYLLAERQTYSAAAHTFKRIVGSLYERFEYGLLLLFRHAYSIVLHHYREFAVTILVIHADFYPAPVGGILEGIGQQVVHEGFQTHCIPPYHQAVHGMGKEHLHLSLGSHVLEVVIDLLDQIHHIQLPDFQPYLSADYPSDVQKLVHKGHHSLCVLVDHVDAVFVAVALGSALAYLVDSSEDQGKRSPELMGYVGKEPDFHIIEVLLHLDLIVQFR